MWIHLKSKQLTNKVISLHKVNNNQQINENTPTFQPFMTNIYNTIFIKDCIEKTLIPITVFLILTLEEHEKVLISKSKYILKENF